MFRNTFKEGQQSRTDRRAPFLRQAGSQKTIGVRGRRAGRGVDQPPILQCRRLLQRGEDYLGCPGAGRHLGQSK